MSVGVRAYLNGRDVPYQKFYLLELCRRVKVGPSSTFYNVELTSKLRMAFSVYQVSSDSLISTI
jgi:hypothetical protein